MKRGTNGSGRGRWWRGAVLFATLAVAGAACAGAPSSAGGGSGGAGSPTGTGGAAPTPGSGGAAGSSTGGAGGGAVDVGGGGPDATAIPDTAPVDGAPIDSGAGSDGAGGAAVPVDPGTTGDGNIMIAAPFKNAPEYTVAPDVKRGQIIRFSMNGADSKIFPGTYMRPAAVYVPAGYVSGTELPFMVAQDGLQFGYLNDVVPVLDNGIAAGTLPAMAVVAADPSNRRSVEYDTVSDAFTRFVETELLPAARAQVMAQAKLDLNLTSDPDGRASYGGSSGGSCAFVMGWFGNYHRILTISGSFRPLQPSAMYPMGAAEFQSRLIAAAPAKPLRVFLEAGSMDLGGWKAANDQMAAALAAKGYHYRYVFAQGAGHTDGAAIRQYLPETMLWLWRGYPIKK